MIAQCLMSQGESVRDVFGKEEMIHVLAEFENEPNVEVMTADDFLTRCYDIGLPELTHVR